MGSENMHAPPLRGYVTMRRVPRGILEFEVFSVTWGRVCFWLHYESFHGVPINNELLGMIKIKVLTFGLTQSKYDIVSYNDDI